jgi:3-hydroxy-9,10-secoandrosta-1,3,5(10)-triene-9,17-dione monooxygenase reductase component
MTTANNTPAIDPRDFRNALSLFATGVTIITTRAENGEPIGITANSFNSVSLDPPMVLWSLAKNAYSLPIFQQAKEWNVHILSNEQEALSNKFAKKGEDKFAGITLDAGVTQSPLLPACTARFQCRTMFEYEGGDHIIFVGEVLAYDQNPTPPLLYLSGNYALATKKTNAIATEIATEIASEIAAEHQGQSPEQNKIPALFSEDLLGYLLGRAHYQFFHAIRPVMQAQGLSESDFFALSVLSVREHTPAEDISHHTAYTGAEVRVDALADLCARGLISQSDTGYAITTKGRDAMVHIIAAAKAEEEALGEKLGALELTALRNLLKRSIQQTDPGIAKLWKA